MYPITDVENLAAYRQISTMTKCCGHSTSDLYPIFEICGNLFPQAKNKQFSSSLVVFCLLLHDGLQTARLRSDTKKYWKGCSRLSTGAATWGGRRFSFYAAGSRHHIWYYIAFHLDACCPANISPDEKKLL